MKLVNFVGPGVAVFAAKMAVEKTAPQYTELASYIVAAGGYYAMLKGMGGEFGANIGVAAVPWAAENLWNRVKGIVGIEGRAASRVALRSSAPSVARNYQNEFATVNQF